MHDHIHVFVVQHPTVSVSELAQKIKNNSSSWLKRHLQNSNFFWQAGYGAFSYAHSQIGEVSKYIENQQEHHKRQTFEHEYRNFLEKFEIDYDEKYIFDFFD